MALHGHFGRGIGSLSHKVGSCAKKKTKTKTKQKKKNWKEEGELAEQQENRYGPFYFLTYWHGRGMISFVQKWLYFFLKKKNGIPMNLELMKGCYRGAWSL